MTTDQPSWLSLTTDSVRQLAPAAVGSFDAVFAALGGAADPVLVELSRRRAASLLGADPQELGPLTALPGQQVAELASWPTSPAFSATERLALGIAEQFVLDVTGIGATERADLGSAIGADLFGFVQGLYVIDHGLRLRLVSRQLFGVEVFRVPTATPDGSATGLWPALESMMTAVVVLDALDPLTAELVRLRGARAHGCRVCTSRRLEPVVAAHGADVLERIDDIDSAPISAADKAALHFTDAMLWTPAALPATVLDGVREHFSPAQALELMLDVSRNASNKIAVALGADEAVVSEGVEYFRMSATGDYEYGVAAPVSG